jgi:hypothetical protein
VRPAGGALPAVVLVAAALQLGAWLLGVAAPVAAERR